MFESMRWFLHLTWVSFTFLSVGTWDHYFGEAVQARWKVAGGRPVNSLGELFTKGGSSPLNSLLQSCIHAACHHSSLSWKDEHKLPNFPLTSNNTGPVSYARGVKPLTLSCSLPVVCRWESRLRLGIKDDIMFFFDGYLSLVFMKLRQKELT